MKCWRRLHEEAKEPMRSTAMAALELKRLWMLRAMHTAALPYSPNSMAKADVVLRSRYLEANSSGDPAGHMGDPAR